MTTIYAVASEWHINFQVHITVKIIVHRVKYDNTYLINGNKSFPEFQMAFNFFRNTPTAVLLETQIFDILTLWRLTTHIGVVPHR